MTEHWLFQCNPRVWDVWQWWEDQSMDLDNWTVGRFYRRIQPGQDMVLWVAGREAGVYAIGTVTSPVYERHHDHDGYWLRGRPPDDRACAIHIDRYLFDRPIRKSTLAAVPGFATALILRMPRAGNPMPVTDAEWDAIQGEVSGTPEASTAQRTFGVLVMERVLGAVVPESTVTTAATVGVVRYREGRLLRDYQNYLERPLVFHAVIQPTGEREYTDAFDEKENLLIEAKASSRRPDIRMAIGQLLDYRRFISPEPSLAILVPTPPCADLLELLRSLDIIVIYPVGGGFSRS